jgi:hypothetical protein
MLETTAAVKLSQNFTKRALLEEAHRIKNIRTKNNVRGKKPTHSERTSPPD